MNRPGMVHLALKLDLIYIAGGRIACALVAIVSIRIATTVMPPAQYGELALLVAVQMFAGLLFVNPIAQHINVNTHRWWDDGTLLARLKPFGRYLIVVAVLGAAVAYAVAQRQSMHYPWLAVIGIFLLVMAGAWNQTLMYMLNMLGMHGASAFWSVATAGTSLFFAAFLAMTGQSPEYWLLGLSTGMLAGAYGARWQLRNRIPTRLPSHEALHFISRQVAMSYCLPLAFAATFMWVQFSGYRFFVENYWGVEKLGFLVVGMQVASQFWILIESLAMQFFYPLMFKQVSQAINQKDEDAALSNLLNTLLPVYFILTGMLLLSAKYILSILAAPQYQAALTFTLLGAGIELCRSVGNVLGLAAQVKRKTHAAALPYGIGAATALVLIGWAGSQRMDVSAAAFALALAGAVMLVTMIGKMSRLVKFSIDLPRLLTAFLVMIGMATLHTFVPDVVGVGWRLAILFGFGALVSLLVLLLMYGSPSARSLLAVRLRKGAI